MRRRSLLLGGLAIAPLGARSQGAQSAHPLRLGADLALVDSDFAGALRRGFSADTGIRVEVVRAPVSAMLDALAAGELDAALANAPAAEAGLAQQGLIHDRRLIAGGEFVIVGPVVRARERGAAGNVAGHSVAAAFAQLRDLGRAQPGGVSFLSANDGSGCHLAEQATWRLAGIAPEPPWYQAAAPATSLIAQARARGAYALVERGAWGVQGGAPLAVLVDGDAQSAETVHAMRSFRSPHPAAKLFMTWIAGGRGRAIVKSHRGYRTPTV